MELATTSRSNGKSVLDRIDTGSPQHGVRVERAELPLWREAFVALDWLALRTSRVYFGLGIPRGDGSPVIVVPGFLAADACLAELHAWLARVGYRPHFSGIGMNVECPDVLIARLLRTVEKVCDETGLKVRLVGHSLGGLLARGAAIRRPELIAQVITLGSPVRGVAAHPMVLAAAELVGGRSGGCLSALQQELPRPIREASIYTKDDGVVDWRTCVQKGDATNVEVRGTHTGLICNPGVYQALAGLLASIRATRTEGPRDVSWADDTTFVALQANVAPAVTHYRREPPLEIISAEAPSTHAA